MLSKMVTTYVLSPNKTIFDDFLSPSYSYGFMGNLKKSFFSIFQTKNKKIWKKNKKPLFNDFSYLLSFSGTSTSQLYLLSVIFEKFSKVHQRWKCQNYSIKMWQKSDRHIESYFQSVFKKIQSRKQNWGKLHSSWWFLLCSTPPPLLHGTIDSSLLPWSKIQKC